MDKLPNRGPRGTFGQNLPKPAPKPTPPTPEKKPAERRPTFGPNTKTNPQELTAQQVTDPTIKESAQELKTKNPPDEPPTQPLASHSPTDLTDQNIPHPTPASSYLTNVADMPPPTYSTPLSDYSEYGANLPLKQNDLLLAKAYQLTQNPSSDNFLQDAQSTLTELESLPQSEKTQFTQLHTTHLEKLISIHKTQSLLLNFSSQIFGSSNPLSSLITLYNKENPSSPIEDPTSLKNLDQKLESLQKLESFLLDKIKSAAQLLSPEESTLKTLIEEGLLSTITADTNNQQQALQLTSIYIALSLADIQNLLSQDLPVLPSEIQALHKKIDHEINQLNTKKSIVKADTSNPQLLEIIENTIKQLSTLKTKLDNILPLSIAQIQDSLLTHKTAFELTAKNYIEKTLENTQLKDTVPLPEGQSPKGLSPLSQHSPEELAQLTNDAKNLKNNALNLFYTSLSIQLGAHHNHLIKLLFEDKSDPLSPKDTKKILKAYHKSMAETLHTLIKTSETLQKANIPPPSTQTIFKSFKENLIHAASNSESNWKKITNSFSTSHNGKNFQFAEEATPAYDLLPNEIQTTYQKEKIRGTPSTNAKSNHTTNLWKSTLSIDGKTAHSVFRHGIFCAKKIKDKETRKLANENKAREYLLTLANDKIKNRQLNPDGSITLNPLLLSLVTPDRLRGFLNILKRIFTGKILSDSSPGSDERAQLQEHQDALAKVIQEINTASTYRAGSNEDPGIIIGGTKYKININPPLQPNFGVNQGAVEGIGPIDSSSHILGSHQFSKDNNQAAITTLCTTFGISHVVPKSSRSEGGLSSLKKDLETKIQKHSDYVQLLLNSDSDTLAKIRGRYSGEIAEPDLNLAIQEEIQFYQNQISALKQNITIINRLLSDPDNIQRNIDAISQLQSQITQMWQSGDYTKAGHDPYKMSARIVVLSQMLGYDTSFFCMSGKDRTSQTDAEAKFILAQIATTGQVPDYTQPLSSDYQPLYRKFVLNPISFGIQKANVLLGGYKLKLRAKGDLDPLAQKLGSQAARDAQFGGSSIVKG